MTKSDPCKRCGNAWFIEIAGTEVCPWCCLHVDEERRKCPRCQWQGWGFPGADCPSCGLAGEDEIGKLLS